ncbi:MAG: phosphopyruvate hydratase [Haloquadratum sp.]|jgi:enolase|nr:phosphopyruvate hydratase [Haloferacaceae archaeon]MDR9445435.1 phosphopyruvate hydratase [Haloquadratum sp.]
MTQIVEVSMRSILDSRGNPTVEADVLTDAGGFGRAAAPSGASTGAHEAIELPVPEAIAAAREHAVPRLVESAYADDQREVDAILRAADGTDNFGQIGANTAVAISMAAAKAAADGVGAPLFHHLGGAFRGRELPVPLGNVVGGGAHATDATDIQEFLVAPVGAPNVSEAVFANAAVHAAVGERLAADGVPAGLGDEGAWAPQLDDAAAFELLSEVVAAVGDELGFSIRMGLDVAATELYDPDTETYVYTDEARTPDEQVAYIRSLIERYDLLYVEDPLEEDDYDGFAALTAAVDDAVLVCGDDLFVTNTDRLARGIQTGAANTILIKPNQIGTLSDTADAIALAQRAGYTTVISHRSGETTDATIAHLAVATGAGYIKTGAVGGERTAKLNELIRIAEEAV